MSDFEIHTTCLQYRVSRMKLANLFWLT
jgi:hypothetical protein